MKYFIGVCDLREHVRDSGRDPAKDGEPVQGCVIKLATASEDCLFGKTTREALPGLTPSSPMAAKIKDLLLQGDTFYIAPGAFEK